MKYRNIELYISYDGRAFYGFNSSYGMRTVQSELQKCLSAILSEPIKLHAIQGLVPGCSVKIMPVYFVTSSSMDVQKMVELCNLRLNTDIRICFGREAEYANGNPAKKMIKEYEYRFLNHPMPMALSSGLCGCRIEEHLNLDAMREAAYLLIGEYDFSSFTTGHYEDPYRTIYNIDIERDGCEIVVRMSGSGFLMHMVQMLTGELIRIGRGELLPDDILERIAMRTPDPDAPEMPVGGLMLVRTAPIVHYEDVIHNCNEDADYYVIQRNLKDTGCVYVILMHCADNVFDKLLYHIVHLAYLDEIKEVYVLDKNGGRLKENMGVDVYKASAVSEIPNEECMLEFDISGDWYVMKR